MNKFTLEFESQYLERKYQNYSQKTNIPQLVMMNNFLFIFALLPSLIMSIVNMSYFDVVVYVICAFSLFFLNFLIRKFQNYYNILINFSFFGLLSLAVVRIMVFGTQVGEGAEYALLFLGCTMIQTQSIFHNLCSSFMPSASNLILQNIMFLVVVDSDQMYSLKYIYICLNMLMVFFLYTHLKQIKMSFMLQQQEKQWKKIVKNGFSQQIITVKFDHKENNLSLDIVNKNARQRFKILNEQDFKDFSRKLVVFTSKKNAIHYPTVPTNMRISCDQEEKSHLGQTLEKQIIAFFKEILLAKQNKVSMTDFKKSETLKNKSKNRQSYHIKEQNSINQKYCKSIKLYTRIKPEESQESDDHYEINLYYFQSQIDHKCCIIFDTQSDQEKLTQSISNQQTLQSNFVSITLKIGLIQFLFQHPTKYSLIIIIAQKAQFILQNLQNFERARQYLYQVLYELQNVYDHHLSTCKIKSNQMVIPVQSFKIADVVTIVQETFWEFRNKFIFEYKNCTENSILHTNMKTMCQIFVNFIINSLHNEIEEVLKPQNMSKSCQPQQQQQSPTPSLPQFLKTPNYGCKSQRQKQISATTNNSNIYKNSSYSDLINDNRFSCSQYTDLISSKRQDQSATQINQKNKQDLSVSQPRPRQISASQLSQTRIKFTQLNGNNEKSHILKITVKDDQGGVSPVSILKYLRDTNFQTDKENNNNYTKFQNLGWKVNNHSIGKIGPYSLFFISRKYLQGLKISFYIYTDLSIFDDKFNNLKFENSQFLHSYQSKIDNSFHKHHQASSKISTLTNQFQDLQQDKIYNDDLHHISESETNFQNIQEAISVNPIVNERAYSIPAETQKSYFREFDSERFDLTKALSNLPITFQEIK